MNRHLFVHNASMPRDDEDRYLTATRREAFTVLTVLVSIVAVELGLILWYLLG